MWEKRKEWLFMPPSKLIANDVNVLWMIHLEKLNDAVISTRSLITGRGKKTFRWPSVMLRKSEKQDENSWLTQLLLWMHLKWQWLRENHAWRISQISPELQKKRQSNWMRFGVHTLGKFLVNEKLGHHRTWGST